MKPALSLTKDTPRLSVDLPLNHPLECGECGAKDSLSTWQEHDAGDEPEPIFVVLCGKCSDRLIEPHPRLYRLLAPNEPAPGVMPLCINCTHRAGSHCWHPRGRRRGGRGLRLEYPSPMTAFWDGTDKRGRRTGGPMTLYPGIVYHCEGKELAASLSES